MLQYIKTVLSLLILLYCTSSTATFAQDYSKSVDYIKNFNNFQEKLPRESIFIHTDRDIYFEGDRAWFSAYIVTSGYNFLSELSKILHLELVSPSGELVEKISIKIKNGRGQGSFYLKNLPNETGTYHLRAYTLWGLNFGSDNVFNKSLSIVSKGSKNSNKELKQFTDVQFFPEGGPLLSNISTRIGIKAINQNGLGQNVSGTIYNSSDESVTNFETRHLGMGVVEFIPKPSTNYYAMVNGKRFDLPQVSEGASIAIEQTKEFFNVEIRKSRNQEESDYLLFTHVSGKIYNVLPIKVDSKSLKIAVSKKDLASGVVHFTLLSTSGHPISERVAFNKNPIDELEVKVSMTSDDLKLRDRAELNVLVTNSKGSSKSATASMSVFDDNINEFSLQDASIESYFYLESEIKGFIEKPGYYFSEAKESKEHLDLLLMTQGWKSFNVAKSDSSEKFVFNYLPQEGFSISGKIVTPWTSKPIKDAVVAISIGGDNENLQILTTNKDGQFSTLPIVFEGKQLVSIRANKENGKDNLKIKIDDLKKAPPIDNIYQNLQPDLPQNIPNTLFTQPVSNDRIETAQKYSEEFIDVMMRLEMDEITVTAKRKAEDLLSKQYFDQVFGDIKTVDSDFLNSAYKGANLATVIRGLGAYYEEPSRFNFNLRASQNSQDFYDQELYSLYGGVVPGSNVTLETTENLILLDNVYISQGELNSYKAGEIESISYQNDSPYSVNPRISIKTKNGAGFRRGYVTKFIEGIQSQATFYSPKYGVTVDPNSEHSDQRLTLHWEPKIDLEEGESTNVFWTNDIPSTYRIVIQGLTEDGIPFVATETFRVSE